MPDRRENRSILHRSKYYRPPFNYSITTEPIILANGVHAFRVMATLENNTGYNLSGASVRVFFGAEPGELLDVFISEKIIYKATSTTEKSHLIRSDVPVTGPLYQRLNEIYLSADISEIKISLNEVIFEEA